MRINYNYGKGVSALNEVKATNPALLYSKDIQAFAVVKEYRQAIRTEQAAKAQAIREANTDLVNYFAFIDNAVKANPYYEV